MPGFLLHLGATVLCSHGGQAQPTAPNPRVMLSRAAGRSVDHAICRRRMPVRTAGNPGPCVTAQWVTGTTRVTSNGQPLLVQSGQAICVPTGTPLLPLAMQTRVTAQ